MKSHIVYETFKVEIEKTISVMTGQISVDLIEQKFNTLDYIYEEELNIENKDEINNNNSNLYNEIYDLFDDDSDKDNASIEDLIVKDIKMAENNYSSISFNLEEEKDVQENKIDDKDIDNWKLDNDENKLDINNIKNERGDLNIFTLEILPNNELLKDILISK